MRVEEYLRACLNDPSKRSGQLTTIARVMPSRGEWPSGLARSISLTEVKHGLCTVSNWMGHLPDERAKQLIPPSFGREVKLGVSCLDVACIWPKLAGKVRNNSLLKIK